MQVRQMLGEGQVDEAQALCAEVTDTLLSSLLADKHAYKEYVAGWDLQRKYAVSEAVDMSVGAPKKEKGKKGGSGGVVTFFGPKAVSWRHVRPPSR